MMIFGGAKPTDARHSGEQKGQNLWSLRGIFDLLKQTYQKWSKDKAPRLGASGVTVSLVLSAAFAAVGAAFHGWLPAPEVVLQVLNFIISFGVISLLFAL